MIKKGNQGEALGEGKCRRTQQQGMYGAAGLRAGRDERESGGGVTISAVRTRGRDTNKVSRPRGECRIMTALETHKTS